MAEHGAKSGNVILAQPDSEVYMIPLIVKHGLDGGIALYERVVTKMNDALGALAASIDKTVKRPDARC